MSLDRISSLRKSLRETARMLENHSALFTGLYFCMIFLLCFMRLSDLGLQEWDDMTHAAFGWSIIKTGDWFTMHQGFTAAWIKPPLYFWFEAVFFRWFGPSVYGARFPAALAGFGTFILIYKLVRHMASERLAQLSIVVLSTSFLFVKYSRRAMLDAPVAFCTTLGVYALVRAQENRRYYALFGLAVALGYYTKAVQGLYVLPIAVLYLFASGRGRRLLDPYFLLALTLGIGLVAAWAVPQWRVYGWTFMDSQCAWGPLLHRGAGEGSPAPFYSPMLWLLKVDWPWIPVSLCGLWLLIGTARRESQLLAALVLIWVAVIVGVLSLSHTFYQRYLVPVIPPLAIAAACALERLLPERALRAFPVCIAGLMALGLLTVNCFPIPLDLSGSKRISLYQTANYVLPEGAPVYVYKAPDIDYSQGMTFHSSHWVIGELDKPVQLLERRRALGVPVFAITTPDVWNDMLLSDLLKPRVRVVAHGPHWILFEVD